MPGMGRESRPVRTRTPSTPSSPAPCAAACQTWLPHCARWWGAPSRRPTRICTRQEEGRSQELGPRDVPGSARCGWPQGWTARHGTQEVHSAQPALAAWWFRVPRATRRCPPGSPVRLAAQQRADFGEVKGRAGGGLICHQRLYGHHIGACTGRERTAWQGSMQARQKGQRSARCWRAAGPRLAGLATMQRRRA